VTNVAFSLGGSCGRSRTHQEREMSKFVYYITNKKTLHEIFITVIFTYLFSNSLSINPYFK
jgi:hypothetical protein